MSADAKVTRNIIEKNSLHIILFLLLIYFIYNNLHLGFLLLILIIFIIYYTNLRNFLLSQLSTYDKFKNLSSSFNCFLYNTIDDPPNQNNECDQPPEQDNDSNDQNNEGDDSNDQNNEDDNSNDQPNTDYVIDENEDDETNEILRTIHEELSG